MKRRNYYQVHKNKKPKVVFNKIDQFLKYILYMIKKDEKSNDSTSLENPIEQFSGIFVLERTSKFEFNDEKIVIIHTPTGNDSAKRLNYQHQNSDQK